MQSPQFASPADVAERLSAAGYLTDDAIATTVFLADRLGKPLLVEGPAGVGGVGGRTDGVCSEIFLPVIARAARNKAICVWQSLYGCAFVARTRRAASGRDGGPDTDRHGVSKRLSRGASAREMGERRRCSG